MEKGELDVSDDNPTAAKAESTDKTDDSAAPEAKQASEGTNKVEKEKEKKVKPVEEVKPSDEGVGKKEEEEEEETVDGHTYTIINKGKSHIDKRTLWDSFHLLGGLFLI